MDDQDVRVLLPRLLLLKTINVQPQQFSVTEYSGNMLAFPHFSVWTVNLFAHRQSWHIKQVESVSHTKF